MRGHEKDIVSVAVLRETGGGDINWENPSHPLVVSLSGDGSVKAWDVTQVSRYGRKMTTKFPLFSRENSHYAFKAFARLHSLLHR